MEVKVEECIDEVMKLTLTEATLGVLDLGLSPEFCSNLPQLDSHHQLDFTQGVPSYPLYKNLASALCKSISNEFINPEQQEWNKLIQALKKMDFHLHVQQPFFSQLKDGLKTVEGRCAVGDYKRISSGALILFNKCLVLQVQDVHKYASFSEMLEAESIEKVLPGVKGIEEGVQIYRNFYP